MLIQEEMYKLLESMIQKESAKDGFSKNINLDKAKDVAKMLTELSVDNKEVGLLTNQYIARIKNICAN